MLLSLATLMRYPQPTCDETSYASAAFSLMTPGSHSPLSFSAGMPGAQGLFAVLSFGHKLTTYNIALGVLLSISRSLMGARLFAFAGWLLAGALAFSLGKRMFSRDAGLIAAALFLTSTKAYLTGHTARPEIWVAAAILLAVVLAYRVAANTDPLPSWLPLLAGVTAIWPGEIHMDGFPFTAGIGLAVLIELGLRQRRWRDLALFVGGAAVGFTLWIALLLLSGIQPQEILGLQRFISPVSSGVGGGAVAGQFRWLRNLRTLPDWLVLIYWRVGGPITLIEAALALIGVVYAVVRGGKPHRFLIITALIAMAIFGIVHRERWVHYGVLWSPIWYLLGSSALLALLDRWQSHRPRAAALSLIAALLIVQLAGMAWLGRIDRGAGYAAMGRAIREHVPSGRSVIADPVWWWSLPDRVFLSDEYFSYATETDRRDVQQFIGVEGPLEVADAVQRLYTRLEPDYVILDDAVACFSAGDARRDALRAIVAMQCDEIGVVPAGGSLAASGALTQTSTIFRCHSDAP